MGTPFKLNLSGRRKNNMKYDPKQPLSLLIVDDDEVIVEMLTSYLGDEGYLVKGFINPLEAIEHLKSHTYDLIITDLKMDELSGTELVDSIREEGLDTVVIIITGYASVQSAIRAIQQRVYDYLQKPFKLVEIKAVVDRAAEKLRLQRENEYLNRRIEKMLTDITMLYEISNILYQVPVFNTTMDMVLDTLTEGIKISSAALFKYDGKSDQYIMIQSRGLDDKSLVSQFQFREGSQLNQETISLVKPTVLTDTNGDLILDGKPLNLGDASNHCILFPIRYNDVVIGFLGIFDVEHSLYEEQDELKLLSILATQIAPLFHESNQQQLAPPTLVSDTSEEMGLQMINDTIHPHGDSDYHTFFLMKLVPHSATGKGAEYQVEKSQFINIVREEFSMESVTIQHFFDTLLISIRNQDMVSLELTVERARSRLEELLNHSSDHQEFSVIYANATFPRDGETGDEIYQFLVNKIMNETSLVHSAIN